MNNLGTFYFDLFVQFAILIFPIIGDIIMPRGEKKMRKLNYDITVGTVFELPSMSWQVHEVKGVYRVEVDDIDRWGEIYCQCVNLDSEYAPKILIPKMCIAFLLAEEISAKANVVYNGEEYQPSGLDDFRYAQEDGDYDGDFPFWYCGHCGDKRIIRCDMWTGKIGATLSCRGIKNRG